MSFLITGTGGLTSGWEELRRTPQRNREGGWDRLVIEGAYTQSGGISEDDLLALWATGEQLGSQNLWLDEVAPEEWAGQVTWKVRLVYLGIFGTRPRVNRISAGSDEQGAENILVPDFGLAEKVSAKVPVPTVESDYVLIGETPNIEQIGTAQLPPILSGVEPENPWSSLSDFTYQYPNGWVLSDRRATPAPTLDGESTPAWLVTDIFQWRFAIKP